MFKPFSFQVLIKVQKLIDDVLFASDSLDDWITCQRNWNYLENIFASGDIKKRLGTEAANFEKIDQYFNMMMNKVKTKPGVLDKCVFCFKSGVRTLLDGAGSATNMRFVCQYTKLESRLLR